jgi:hypothetical protein
LLRYIPPALLEEAWPLIYPGLLKVQDHSFESDLPEQIKISLYAGVAFLFMAMENDRYVGFAVLRPEQTMTGRKGLHIWATYSDGAPMVDCFQEVETMAREQGFQQITFSSPRKGWARRMKDFEPTYQTYRKLL